MICVRDMHHNVCYDNVYIPHLLPNLLCVLICQWKTICILKFAILLIENTIVVCIQMTFYTCFILIFHVLAFDSYICDSPHCYVGCGLYLLTLVSLHHNAAKNQATTTTLAMCIVILTSSNLDCMCSLQANLRLQGRPCITDIGIFVYGFPHLGQTDMIHIHAVNGLSTV